MKLFKTLREILHAMVGAPDYQRYLKHVSARHPGEPPLSYEDFYLRALHRRTKAERSRCC